jgi:hypothetical protein
MTSDSAKDMVRQAGARRGGPKPRLVTRRAPPCRPSGAAGDHVKDQTNLGKPA